MRRICAIAILLLSLSACTPAQLASLGIPEHGALLELPDEPVYLADRIVWPDGNVSFAPAGSRCPQWYGYARQAGWQETEWQRLDTVMWRESRCDPMAHGIGPRDDSRGLTQVNLRAHRSWIGPMIDWNFDVLFDPATNLSFARIIFERAGGSWTPWRATAY